MSAGKVISVNISKEKGTIKTPVPQISVTSDGIENDAHSGSWHRQISLLAKERIEEFSQKMGRKISAGEFAENITTKGLDLSTVTVLSRFTIGKTKLEVTQIGKKCHGNGCTILREVGKCIMPHTGIFCKVISGGTIMPGDTITYNEVALRIAVITSSDRASKGEYEDKSGHEIIKMTEAFFANKPWKLAFKKTIVPDEHTQLENAIRTAAQEASIVFITGGTGIGPRDITPEIVEKIIDREIPGIMDFIRMKYGSKNPNALLSRSIAGTLKSTLIYAMPGSVRAVKEYVEEILKTIEHSILMIKGINTH